MNLRLAVRMILVACAVGVVSVVVSGQTARPSHSGPADDELVAEIRGLRADLARAMCANIRAQLLVGRLQLQEQRMNALGAELAAVRRSLADAEAERTKKSGQIYGFQVR